MGCHNDVLPCMTRDQLMHGSKAASLGHDVRFTVSRRVCGDAPRLPNDSFEITRGDRRQVTLAQLRHHVDANATALREPLHRLDRALCRAGINCRNVSVGTSGFVLSVVDTSAAWIYLNRGAVLPMLVVPSLIGVILGAKIGARLLRVAPASLVKRIVLAVLVIAGGRALLKGFGI